MALTRADGAVERVAVMHDVDGGVGEKLQRP